jgi:toxin ParE1/3/4
MSRYVISDEAIEDLDRISAYFLQNNLETGEQFLQAFNAKCQQLISFPKIGRSYSHLRAGVRGIACEDLLFCTRHLENQKHSTSRSSESSAVDAI